MDLNYKIVELERAIEQINYHINNGVYDFNFKLYNDILSIEELKIYEIFLLQINQLIIDYYKKNIIINMKPFSDIYCLKHGIVYNDNFIMCTHCPCYHCVPDETEFNKYTKCNYIPPMQFCQKHFLELKSAITILKNNNIIHDIDYINFEEHLYNCIMLYGNDLVIDDLFKNNNKQEKIKKLINKGI